ncbi:MAG TPA: hypothetical protein VM599_04270 [Thermoanaerobaculia bacterium]|nr:hypothetical protein [Thermoanaerobaculia bacterium]
MTDSGHLSRELLDGFFMGRVSPLALVAETAEHLEATCPECRRRLPPGPALRRAFREARRRVRARAAEIETERAELPRRLAELAEREGSEVLLAVAGSARFHTAAFVEYQLGVGWPAVERGELAAAREAVELGYLAALRLAPDRYGSIAVARLETESLLLRARLALAQGAREEAELALEAAERLVPECVSDDLRAGLLLGRASLLAWRDEAPAARRILDEASRISAEGRAERWRPSIETSLARLDRGEGRPEAGARRLRTLLLALPDRPRNLPAWSAARELVCSLVASGELGEAAAFVARWRGDEKRCVGEGQAELAHAQGLVLSALERRLAARRALWTAWVLYRLHGRALDAAMAALELALLCAAPGPAGEALTSRESLVCALEDLVLREPVPGEGLVLIARLARALCRDRLDERELAEIEGLYFRLRPAWGVAGHGAP